MGAYAKAFIATLGTVAASFLAVITNDLIQPIELVNLALLGLGSFVVYLTPNMPGYSYAKTGVLAVTAGLQYLLSALQTDADLTWSLWAQVITTGIAAVLVAAHGTITPARTSSSTVQTTA